MVPNMCKIPTKPWFLGGANIRGLPNTIRYTTKYHPNIKNYSRCLLLGGLVLREGILWQEYDGFFEGTLNYQSSWEIYLTTQIYDKSRFSRHRWTKKEKEITETPIIWRFPIMGVPPNHQVIRPWLSIFKQPWWLGIPHDVRTPIFSPYSPSFTKFGYVFFSSCLLIDRSCGCFVRSSRLWLDSSCVRSGRNLRAFGFQFPAAPEDRWERSLDVAWKGWGPYSTCLKESLHPPEKIGPPNLLNCSFIWDSWPNRWIIWPASQAPQWRISQMGDSDSDSKTWKNGPAEAAERVINPIPKNSLGKIKSQRRLGSEHLPWQILQIFQSHVLLWVRTCFGGRRWRHHVDKNVRGRRWSLLEPESNAMGRDRSRSMFQGPPKSQTTAR